MKLSDILDIFRISKIKQDNQTQQTTTSKRELKEIQLQVVGVYYRMENVKKLYCPNPDYKKRAKSIANSDLVNKKIYQYTYVNKPVKLVPEPKNEHDKNAIAVYIAGEHVGYISRDENIKINKILKSNEVKFISSFISGGPYKIVSQNGTSVKIDNSIKINIKIGYV